MGKKFLIPAGGQFYKANMHCHSTFSDGALTVEELKHEYMKRGYSIIAFTDHNTYQWHNELDDENFLALCGYEVDICASVKRSWLDAKVCHLNVYDKHPAKGKKNEVLSAQALYEDKASMNNYIKKMTDAGYLVCYNHPGWSLERYEDYMPLDGFFAMEVFNTGCAVTDGTFDYNNRVYDDMLAAGKRVFPFAADDNHNRNPLDSVYNDSFGGYLQIKAPELSYSAVMDSIEKGDFYASTGAEIEQIYIEDGKIHVIVPKSKMIYGICNCRTGQFPKANEGENLTHGVFTVIPEMDYIRFEVVDTLEKRAYSRAYYKDEINNI
ncbi:MAG TPA: PHP domain-containing protein [Bacillota bacterium]|nr:PHP domain-containing protein [Bacillota bacterium]